MILRPALLLPVLLALAACSGGQNEPPAASAPTAPPPAVADAAVAEPTPAASPDVPIGPAPVAGIDYIEIPGGQPFAPADGRIEVAEIFSYTCPHCAHFEPLLHAWRARQPADVTFVPVAGPFGANPLPFAQAFYAAETLGVRAKTHQAVFNAIHVEATLNPMDATPQGIAAFYGKFGADPAQFAQAMASADTSARLQHALTFIQKSGIESTPGVVVAGKYRVTGKTMEDMLRITTHLVAKERAARGG